MLEGNWNSQVKEALVQLIEANKHRKLNVIFDFDNTILCHDIGDSCFDQLVQNKLLNLDLARNLSPDFDLDNQLCSLDQQGFISYYKNLHRISSHQFLDSSPHVNAYAWAVQVTGGCSVLDIVKAVKRAVSTNDLAYFPIPFPYLEMISLLGLLLLKGFRVYIVSASYVWAVRWVVKYLVNSELERRFGEGIGVRPENIMAMSCLLKDKRTGLVYKDDYLVKQNERYKDLDLEELDNYCVVPLLDYPVTSYDGKVAAIYKLTGEVKPFLVAGDSMNDLPMMQQASSVLLIGKQGGEEEYGYMDLFLRKRGVNTFLQLTFPSGEGFMIS